MVDGVLLLVDAVEGPMPQTRFVTRKALALGLKPIVVVNKVDRPGARAGLGRQPHLRPLRQARRDRGAARLPGDLRLGPERLGDARAKGGTGSDLRRSSTRSSSTSRRTRTTPDGPLQLQICSLDYSSYVGRIGIGRVNRGTLSRAGGRGLRRSGRGAGPGARQPGARRSKASSVMQATEAGRATSCSSTASRTSASASRSPTPSSRSRCRC